MDQKPPTPLETLALWGLAGKGGSAWLDGLRPTLRSRKNLLALGLIQEEKEMRTTGKRPVKATKISLAAAGWKWLEEHAGEAIPTRSTAGAEVLANLLGVVSSYLKAQELPLAALWRTAPPAEPQPKPTAEKMPVSTEADYRREVLSACRRLADASGRIRLADLRAAFAKIPAADFEAMLLTLQKQGKLVLYPLDNPRDITPEDREAALDIAGFAVHVVYLA